jgi:hypothetical protein
MLHQDLGLIAHTKSAMWRLYQCSHFFFLITTQWGEGAQRFHARLKTQTNNGSTHASMQLHFDEKCETYSFKRLAIFKSLLFCHEAVFILYLSLTIGLGNQNNHFGPNGNGFWRKLFFFCYMKPKRYKLKTCPNHFACVIFIYLFLPVLNSKNSSSSSSTSLNNN